MRRSLGGALGTALASSLLLLACGRSTAPATPPASAPAPASETALAPHESEGKAADPEPMVRSAAPFTNAEQAFQTVRETLRRRYHREVTDDELYRAAVAGMLQNLEPQLAPYNKLLSPEEVRGLTEDLKGEFVGVGVAIRFDEPSGTSDVVNVIPGSPAERAGVRDGDKILTVAGKSYKGKTLRDVVADIRGPVGETVALSILRGTEVRTFTIKRERLTYETVTSMMLPGDVGYLLIRQFSETTPKAVRAGLQELLGKRARALLVDLRDNQGGLFEQAASTASLLLKRGTTLAKVRRRGEPERLVTSEGSDADSGGGGDLTVPVALLIDGETASSAEMLAGALREATGALLVGGRTRGKGSVQTVEDLPNHYAIKFTTGEFLLPSGQRIEGAGLVPDVEVTLPVPDGSTYGQQLSRVQRLGSATERLAQDVQLRAAYNMVRFRIQPERSPR
ncbi:MAG: S41 family peptidase [Polyangia bacterium]